MTRSWALLLTLLGMLLGAAEAAAKTRVLVVGGLGGNDKYAEEFQSQVDLLTTHLRGVTDDVVLLADGGRVEVEAALRELAGRTSDADTLVFVYIGHGTYDGEAYRFNVLGRDFTGAELDAWLAGVEAKHQLVVVAGSSSGALLETLQGAKRTTITATRSGDQKNATVFGRYFTAALDNASADVNKDQRISASEAFAYAKDRVERYYEEKNQMATEHPQRQGPEPVIVLAQLVEQTIDPEFAHLIDRRESLELEIEQLKAGKDLLSQDDYLRELQRLLLDLAVVESQIDAAAGRASP